MSPDDFKAWRAAVGLTQTKAAEALGISRQTVENYERGHRVEDKRAVAIPPHIGLACAAIANDLPQWTGGADNEVADDWYWAVHNVEPARQKFIIENGREALFARAIREFGTDRQLAWMPAHRGSHRIKIDHILNMLLTVVPHYRVDHNQFVMEAAKIPVFAQFLHDAPSNLSDYVSNSVYSDALIPLEAYSPASTRRLGSIVSATLDIDDDWYDA